MKRKKPPAPKAALYETVRHVAAARLTLGLSRAAIDYLRHASECVSGDDLGHGRTPWCYERVDDMANLLGVDPRTVRNIEHRLADLGLIERRAMANGHRWAKRNRTTGDIEWVHGISLQPLIERRDELAALATRIADQERAYRAARQKVHNLRARLRDALTLASGLPALAALRDQTWAVHDAIPARLNRQAHDLDHLTRLVVELTLALDALLMAFAQAETMRSDPVSDAVDKASVDVKISDAAEISTRHKYDTTPKSLYSCNYAEPPNGGTSSSFEDRANARSCLENKYAGGEAAHKPRNSVPEEIVMTPDGLLALAPDRWREAIDGIERPDWNVIGYVAAARRAELGVSDHAWRAGIEGMGERRAAMCLAVLDANRDHPTKPVRSVGGAFVAMTRRAASGDLHLAPSLRWIAARQAGVDPSAREAADG